jgi:hypothetical protein
MAGSGADLSTDEWRWPIDEREFVAGLLGGNRSEGAAKKVLEDALDQRVIPWLCQSLKTEFGKLDPRICAGVVGAKDMFWRRESHTTINVDYPNHCAVRIGPPWFFRRGPPISGKALGSDLDVEMPNFLFDEGPTFLLGQPHIKLTANLIKLHHGGVVRRCRYLGLLPPSPPPSPVSPQAAPAAPAAPEPAPETASNEVPAPSVPESAPEPRDRGTETEQPTDPTKVWIAEKAGKLKGAGKIPADIRITALAKMLEGELCEAHKVDHSIKTVGWRHIKNMLPTWGLWPVSKIPETK